MLPKIPYSKIRYYVQQSQTAFNFTQISEPLKNLLLVILSQGVPKHIYATGHSTFTAALIYGITHCLPITLLHGLTFTTYESNIKEVEAIVLGTMSGANLSDITELHVQPSAPTGPLSPDIQLYVQTALNALMTGNMTKLNKVIDEVERNGFDTTDRLIEQFYRRFRRGSVSLTIKQLENIVRFPNDNIDELLDPGVQQESAALLLNSQEYWKTTGKNLFSVVVAGLQPNVKRSLTPQASEALMLFINGVNVHVLAALQTAIQQGGLPRQCTEVMLTLAPPKSNAIIYQKMITDFAQGETYQRVTSNTLWPFQDWVVQCAKLIQPQPTIQQMQPWLRIPAWDKLDTILKHALPNEWEQFAMLGLLERDIPKGAVLIVQAYEATFTALLQRLLQQGSQLPKPDYTEIVVRFFAAMVEHDYPKRVPLLLDLLNTTPKEPTVVERLLSVVRPGTPHRLFAEEIEILLTNCGPEVIAACGSSPTLVEYIRGYMLFLSPSKLDNKNVQQILVWLLNGEPSLPTDIADLVARWTAIADFLQQEAISRQSLRDVEAALQRLLPTEQSGGNDQQRHMMIAEMLPLLVKQIKTEHDLETVMELLGPLLTPTPWELLCRVAALAGQSYSNPQSFYRLTPYLLCGINKFPRTRYAPDALDAYLHSLYGNVNDDDLRNVDVAAAPVFGVWPELIQQEWRRWRESRKAHWAANIPIVNRMISQQQKTPTGQQPSDQSQNK